MSIFASTFVRIPPIFSILATLFSCYPALGSEKYYYCTPIKDDFTLIRTQNGTTFIQFDKNSKPDAGSSIHLNLKYFDGNIFQFYAEEKDFGKNTAIGTVSSGWGGRSTKHNLFFKIITNQWDCNLEDKIHD